MSTQDPTPDRGPIGRPLLRREDRRFLTGTARYIDDLAVAGAVHARFVRALHGHARIRDIDTEAASAMLGVVRIATGRDLGQWTHPLRLAPAIEGVRTRSHPFSVRQRQPDRCSEHSAVSLPPVLTSWARTVPSRHAPLHPIPHDRPFPA